MKRFNKKKLKVNFELTREEFDLLGYCVWYVYLNNEVKGVSDLLYLLGKIEREYKNENVSD